MIPNPVKRIPTAFSRSAISLSFLFDTICLPPFYDFIIHRFALFVNLIRLFLMIFPNVFLMESCRQVNFYGIFFSLFAEYFLHKNKAHTGVILPVWAYCYISIVKLPMLPALWPISAIGSFVCEVFFQFFRAPSEPPAFPVWPAPIIDSLPVLSSLHSLQSWRARSSAPAAD